MSVPDAYNIALLFIAIYILAWGDQCGRRGMVMFLIATGLTYAGTGGDEPYASFNMLTFVGDVGLMLGFFWLAITGKRYWPLWASAMQMNGVASHIVALLAPVVVAKAYYAMATLWGAPILVVMATGTMLDRRRRLRGIYLQ